MLKRIWICCVALFLWSYGANAYTFPELTAPVVDAANIFNSETERELETILQTEKTHQVVVVSIPSLENTSIEEYGVALGRHWQIGNKGTNDGVLLIIAPNEHFVRIEVGYGLEGVLTDALSSQIIDKIMLPHLKQGNYNEAALYGTENIIKAINGEKINIPEEDLTAGEVIALLICILFFAWIASAPMRNRASGFRTLLAIASILHGFRPSSFKGKGGSFGGGGSSRKW